MQTTWETSQQSIGTHGRGESSFAPAKLDPKSFGLTCGLMWGVGLFTLTWWVMAFDGPSEKPTGLSKLYRGYTISPRGSIIGLVWGFFDALVGGASFAWLYNLLLGRKKRT